MAKKTVSKALMQDRQVSEKCCTRASFLRSGAMAVEVIHLYYTEARVLAASSGGCRTLVLHSFSIVEKIHIYQIDRNAKHCVWCMDI